MPVQLMGLWPTAQTQRITSLAPVTIRIFDENHDVANIGLLASCLIAPSEPGIGREGVVLVQIPHLLRIRQPARVWHEPREKAMQQRIRPLPSDERN